MHDIGEKARQGEGIGLIRDVINRFGKVTGPKGEVLFEYNPNRVDRFLWKVGLYMLDTGRLLPVQPPAGIELINPKRTPEELERVAWFPRVRNTQPMGRYGRVFDYKSLGWRDGNLKGHALAMNYWDGLVAAMLFHDPECACGRCEEWKRGQ